MMHSTVRFASAVACLLLGTTSGCLVATGTESESDLGEVASPIFDGTAATKDQIFSTVALRRLGHDKYMCTGTLIAPSVSSPRLIASSMRNRRRSRLPTSMPRWK